MTSTPIATKPFVITVTAEASVQMLVWAVDEDTADDIAANALPDLAKQLQVTAGLPDPDAPSAPFVTYDHSVRPAYHEEAVGPGRLYDGEPRFHACDCCATEITLPPTTESEPTA